MIETHEHNGDFKAPSSVRPPDIKALAENWYKPQLEERPKAFHRAVQGKLGELSARGMARSPVAYFTAETLAQQEVRAVWPNLFRRLQTSIRCSFYSHRICDARTSET